MKNTFFKNTICGHCANIAQMHKIGSVDKEHIYEDDDIGSTLESFTCFTILECPACNKNTVITYHWHDGMESDNDIKLEVLYPLDEQIPKGLPENILTTYKTARKIRLDDTSSYALLLGRVLELVCIDQGATRGTLGEKLNQLKEKKVIPDNLIKVADAFRVYRNISTHELSGILESEVPFIEALLIAILEYIYSAPLLASLAEKKLTILKSKDRR